MPVDEPFNVYQKHLTSPYHGIALWNPNPVEGLYDEVSIGDVGYICDGSFIRMFNVSLPWNDPSNEKLGKPEEFKTLELDSFTRENKIDPADYLSPHVDKVEYGDTLVIFGLNHPTGESRSCPGKLQSAYIFGTQVLRINARLGVMEQFCHFLTGAGRKKLFAHRFLRSTSATTRRAGSTGRGSGGYPSTA